MGWMCVTGGDVLEFGRRSGSGISEEASDSSLQTSRGACSRDPVGDPEGMPRTCRQLVQWDGVCGISFGASTGGCVRFGMMG